MTGRTRRLARQRRSTLLCAAGAFVFLLVMPGLRAAPIQGPLLNEDATEFFYRAEIPPGKAGEVVDQYIDGLAKAGIKVFLVNTNCRRTNYRSRVWDSFWDGYDPAGPDNQPFLAPVADDGNPGKTLYRKLVHNTYTLDKEGVDWPARVAQRCRRNGMSPWISLRMNDCHWWDVPNHPFHGSFWRNHPEYMTKSNGYFAACLDYGRPQVRDFYKALIVETLDRYDIDGLDLDFMRNAYLFRSGREGEGGKLLTAWMRVVRKLVDEAAARRGHRIYLSARVPTRPKVALALGLDGITWAKEGLIDLLAVAPRYATMDYDIPIDTWRQSLGPSKIALAGGLETRYQPIEYGPASFVSPELAIGGAVSVLSQGADAVYLFNFMEGDMGPRWTIPVYRRTIRAMGSLETAIQLPRRIALTFCDITTGESYHAPLPASGKELKFSMRLGPVPARTQSCEVLIGLEPTPNMPLPAVSVDGTACEFRSDTTLTTSNSSVTTSAAPGSDDSTLMKDGLRLACYTVPPAALAASEVHEIKVMAKGDGKITVRRVEMALGADSDR
jgi:hypothetical protein